MLGIAVGGREDDYEVSGVDFKLRGRLFDRQLGDLKKLWKGDVGVGPSPARGARPALLIGGQSDKAFQRAARYADGWTMGGGAPDQFAQARERLQAAWAQADRDDEPRTLALFYFALGDRAQEIAGESLGDYYAFLPDYVDQIIAGAAKDEDTVRAYLAAFEQAGADEVICFPTSADPAQVELLARAVK